jgi:hypothetical protein
MKYEDGGECECPGEGASGKVVAGGSKFYTADEDEVIHGFCFYYPQINACRVIELEVTSSQDLETI